MKHPLRSNIAPYLVVEVEDDCDLHYTEYLTYEQALEYVQTLEAKSCIIGPICQQAINGCCIEDHT